TTRAGVPILLKHVANVQVGSAFKYGDAIVNGQQGVEIIVSKQPWVDTLDVTKNVEQAVDQLRKTMPPDVHLFYIFRQADFIERSIGNMLSAIAGGGVLVVIVLLVFL